MGFENMSLLDLYHYDGIAIKKESSFYARFCCLLYEQNYLRHCSPEEVSISDVQPSTRVCKKAQETDRSLQHGQGLKNFISSLTSSTDIRDLLSSLSSDLQTFVIKPSKSKEAFKEQASDFMLKWNLLLSNVGKILTINRTDSFDIWHGRRSTTYCKGFQPRYDSKVNGLSESLLAFITYGPSRKSYIEEEKEEGNALVAKQNEVPVLCVYEPSHLSACFAEEEPQASSPQSALVTQNQSNFGLSNAFQSSELFGEHNHCQQAHPDNLGRENFYIMY
ncbi:DNA-binding protein RFX8 [Sylvia borin]